MSTCCIFLASPRVKILNTLATAVAVAVAVVVAVVAVVVAVVVDQ